jgi:hypothetical protein
MGWTTKQGDDKPSIDIDFNELGHRAIFDSSRREVTLHKGESVNDLVEDDGSFKSLRSFQRYAENVLAGPWCAINFVKSFESKPTMMTMLAKTIARSTGRDAETVEGELYDLADLQSRHRTRWAVNSNSHLVRAVNNYLLNPEPEIIFEYMPCDYRVEDMTHSNPEAALPLVGYAGWKEYCKNIGLCIGKAYSVMSEQGNTPDRIVIGGGIGEAFNRYPPLLRRVALKLIHEHGNISTGVVDFSRMSPESRESAKTYQLVDETMQQIRAESRLSVEMAH